MKFQGSLKKFLIVLIIFKTASRKFQIFFEEVVRMFQACFNGVEKVVSKVFKVVSGKFQGCVPDHQKCNQDPRHEHLSSPRHVDVFD